MKTKIILKRVFHHDKWRILISFKYDKGLTALVRRINGVAFSGTYRSWYADDNEGALKQILLIFRDKADIDISALTHDKETEELRSSEEITGIRSVVQKEDTNDKGFETSYTAPEILPDKNSINRVVERQRFSPVEFRINEKDGRLAIKFTGHYNGDWIEEIKSFGGYNYDKTTREFLLPWSVMTGDSLADYFMSQGVEVKVIKSSPSLVLKDARREMGDEVRSRNLGVKALDGLDLMRRYLEEIRYSDRTSKSYLALLEFFFKFFNEYDPLVISMDDLSEFIHDFIIANGYSKSYQNQMISAIKIYYRIVGRSQIDLLLVERPRKSRALPKVFSKDEVQRILNATRNIKHKLLLWVIYSCGLRRSEVSNIRLTDLDRDRNVLHIKEGKGSVDRIVPVSKKVWEKMDEYIEGYQPIKFLFEGQAGGKYSSESVYRVFKQALKRAGIKKDVGVHSLRHSYATHLHESGLDIKYIQELLGHKSTRTTEIYTHVSRRNLVIIRSPIEDMDVR